MSQATINPILSECKDRPAAAAYIKVKRSTLDHWAHTGKYRDLLPFAKIGKKAFYKIADLDRFVAARFSNSAQ